MWICSTLFLISLEIDGQKRGKADDASATGYRKEEAEPKASAKSDPKPKAKGSGKGKVSPNGFSKPVLTGSSALRGW